jgi:signal transduction histidine kinase
VVRGIVDLRAAQHRRHDRDRDELAAGCRGHGDPGQVENAVLNLAVNARDAMPKGGKLMIETALAARRILSSPIAMPSPGPMSLAVTDTGSGMTRRCAAAPSSRSSHQGAGAAAGWA